MPTVTASGVLWDATIGALNSARPRWQRTLRELRWNHSQSGMGRMPLPRCATRHKLGTQTYKDQAGRQIATLFARPARFERSSGKGASAARIY